MPVIPATSRRVAALALAGGALALVALAGAGQATARPSAAPTKVPVFFVVMDEFPGASIQDRQGGIDRRRVPNLYAISRQATYYPNATTNSAITLSSFPSFLSGRLWKGSPPPGRQTVFGLLRRSHRPFQGEYIARLKSLCPFCDADMGSANRIFGKPVRGDDGWQIAPMKSAYSAIRELSRRPAPGEKPAMWHTHLILPHALYRFLPSGNQYATNPESEFPSVSGTDNRLSTNRRLIQADQQRFLAQAGLADRFIGLMRSQLVRAGLWERSMVIIASDHGASAVPGTRRRGLEARNFSHLAGVPLIVKYPGQQAGRIDAGSAQLVDLLPTIAQVTGRKPGWKVDGLSLLAPRPRREVRMYGGEETGWLRRSFSEFVGERASIVEEWNELFPGAPQEAWLGEAPSLRGKPVRSFTAKASGVTATVAESDLLGRVSKRSGLVPALISGVLEGSAAGRPLAVALNGRFVAGGYSYRSNGATRFNILVPEEDLRDGRNTVELFQVEGGRPARVTVR